MTSEQPGTREQPGLKTLTMKPVAVGGAFGIPLGAALLAMSHDESVASLLPILAALPFVLLWGVAAGLRWIVLRRPQWSFRKVLPTNHDYDTAIVVFSFGVGLFLGFQVAASLFAP